MNDSNHMEYADHPGANCPKREWVMTTLADDEVTAPDGTLPRGLEFHIARCDSCRALADRLQAVSNSLASLSALEPVDGLVKAAQDQTRRALAEGAKLTGRVTIPDETEPVTGAAISVPWVRLTRYAAAASVVIAATLYSLSRSGPDVPPPSPRPEQIAVHTQPPVERKQPVEIADRPESRTSETVVDAEETGTAPAPAAMAFGSPGARRQRVCRHRSPFEAALCERPHAMHRAMLPATQRGQGSESVWWLIDNSHSTVNTRPQRPEK